MSHLLGDSAYGIHDDQKQYDWNYISHIMLSHIISISLCCIAARMRQTMTYHPNLS